MRRIVKWTRTFFGAGVGVVGRALRQGVRPDGSELDPDYMPWRLTREMTGDEIGAIWAYLRSLPAKPYGER